MEEKPVWVVKLHHPLVVEDVNRVRGTQLCNRLHWLKLGDRATKAIATKKGREATSAP